LTFLNIKNVDIGYQTPVIKNINLDAYKGELIAVIGKNGCGKTTLLKTIARIITTIKGDIFVKSKNINSFSITKFASLLGFSAISSINVANLTVYDIVRLGRISHSSLIGKLRKEDIEAIEFAIKETEINKLRNNEISKISDGERQRTFIARLIAQQADILIFDEPTAFLDVHAKHKIVSLFKKITKNFNKTIIFSTHDLKLAIQNVDKLWLYSNDKIISNSPEDVILNGTFERIFSDKNIKFNNLTADFDVLKTEIGKVKITSNSSELRYFWTKKALEKLGYTIVNNANIEVVINDNNWIKISNKIKKEFSSIYSLLKNIEND